MVFKKHETQPFENLYVHFILPLATEFVKNSFGEAYVTSDYTDLKKGFQGFLVFFTDLFYERSRSLFSEK